jgi:hypothetical protein
MSASRIRQSYFATAVRYHARVRQLSRWANGTNVPVERATIVALHALTFAGLLAWSWRKWPDPLVDFGRELYIPWQITEGRVLFRDIASLFGPLSPYMNALWFRLFGTSLMSIALCNCAILAATIAGIYHLLHASTDRVAAASATLAAVLLFGFCQYLDVGNYNFITPYAHEATHGLALSVAALVAFYHSIASRRTWLAFVSGVCVGLVLLTKPEIAGALGVSMVVGIAYVVWVQPVDSIHGRALGVFCGGALAPAAAFLAYFVSAGMSLAQASHAVANGWTVAFSTRVARNAFYARVTGFDHPLLNAWHMVQTFVAFLLFVGVTICLARWRPTTPAKRTAALLVRAVFLTVTAFFVPRFGVSRAFPLIAVAGLAAALAVGARRRASGTALQQLPLAMWCCFAIVMLAKMFLNTQVYHYGFYLALPATTVVVVVLVWLIPMAVDRLADPDVARRTKWLFVAAVAVAIVPHLALSDLWFRTKTLPIGEGRDRFLAGTGPTQWQGEAVAEAVSWIANRTPRNATIAVIPEGVMINYLSRRPTSLPFVNFMPPEIIAFGESAIVAGWRAHPPDFVLLIERSTAEYGYSSFGAAPDYGQTTMQWIRSHYERIGLIGRNASGESGSPIVVLKRKG